MQQHGGELWALLEKANQIQARSILEIGSHCGGTLAIWDQLAGAAGRVVGMDNMERDTSGAFSLFNPKFCPYQPVSRLTTLSADSHCTGGYGPQYSVDAWDGRRTLWDTTDTVTIVKDLFQKAPIDLLFIDGDHSYEGVKMDWEMYSPLVRSGGLVAFHDTRIEPRIIRFLDELRAAGRVIEDIPIQGSWHIGIAYTYM